MDAPTGGNGSRSVERQVGMINVPDSQVFDKDSPFTLYYQLKEKLAEKIASHQWKPGEKIPSEAELCDAYSVSRITVRKAIEDLVRSGQLIKHQGKGTFVTNVSMEHKFSKFYSFSEELTRSGMTERAQILSFEIIEADGEVSEKLSMQEGEQVFMVKRLRMADEMPYTVEVSYIPFSICPGLSAENITEKGLYNSMRALNVFPERIIEKIRAAVVNRSDAGLMKIKPNAPAIKLERLTYYGVLTIEYCVSIVRGDFFTYTIELKS